MPGTHRFRRFALIYLCVTACFILSLLPPTDHRVQAQSVHVAPIGEGFFY